jgi:predicted transcriptional regulator
VRIHMKEKEYFNAIYKKLYELRNLGMIETEKILDFLNDSRNYWWYDGAIAEAVNDILEELNIIKKIKKYITDPQS